MDARKQFIAQMTRERNAWLLKVPGLHDGYRLACPSGARCVEPACEGCAAATDRRDRARRCDVHIRFARDGHEATLEWLRGEWRRARSDHDRSEIAIWAEAVKAVAA